MGYEKFSWVVDFSTVETIAASSEVFEIGGCKWTLAAFPEGYENPNYLSLFLVVGSDPLKILNYGWKIHARFCLTVVNQLSDKLSVEGETEKWFDNKNAVGGFQKMLLRSEFNAKDGGFLVNNVAKFIAEVEVLEVIGNVDMDVPEESQEVTQPLKRIKLNGYKETSLVDVNGFQVLPSQVESVKWIFERHPDMALKFRAKNQLMRTSCINVLLSLIKTLCQSLQDLSYNDLDQAKKTLTYLKDSGFKVDWLERKLEEVKEKKCVDIEALIEKEKAKLLAATKAPFLTLD